MPIVNGPMKPRGAADRRRAPGGVGLKRGVRRREGLVKGARSRATTPGEETGSRLHPSFAAIVREFIDTERVSFGGAGFGSRALKLDGRIFAMWSSMGRLVVKLPRDRVAELVAAGRGQYFDPVGGRPMKEWLAVADDPRSWMGLAREAHAYARAAAR